MHLVDNEDVTPMRVGKYSDPHEVNVLSVMMLGDRGVSIRIGYHS